VIGDTDLAGARIPAPAPHWTPILLHLDAATGAVTRTDVFETSAGATVNAIAPVDDGRLIVAGTFRGQLRLRPGAPLDAGIGPLSDGFVAEVTRDGAIGWIVQIRGPGDERVMAVAADDDRVVVTGRMHDTVQVGPLAATTHGHMDILFAELGLDGAPRRVAAFGGTATDDRGRGVALAHDGSAWIAGMFWRSLEYDGVIHRSRGQADGVVLRVPPALEP
jgi:hypothetical protein